MSKTRPSRRRAWFIVHGWLGANLALMMAVLFLSGTLATISYEIDWLFDQRVRAEGREQRISWEELRRLVAQAAPDTQILSIALGPERVILPGWDLPFAARVTLGSPAGDEYIMFVDLQAGRITGTRSYIDFPFLMRQLHYNLFAHPWGFYVNIMLGAWVLGAIVTGLVNYRRFWRGFLRKPRWQASARVLWGDLHRLLALWSLLFLLIVAVTGVWYLVPDLIMKMSERPSSAPPVPVHSTLSWDVLASTAEAAIPGFEIRFIQLPEQPGGPISYWGQAGEMLLHQRGNRVTLDSGTGAVINVHRSSEQGALYRWNDTVDALHFGSFGGLAGRIVWCLFGMATSLLIVSGTIIRSYRLAGEINWALPWLGRWRWLNLALLFLPIYGLLALALG